MELAPLSSVLPREVPLKLPSVKFGKKVMLTSPFSVLGKVPPEALFLMLWYVTLGVLLISGVVVGVLVWKYQNRLVRIYNPSFLDPYTPPKQFGFTSNPEFISKVKQGESIAKTKSLVICGLIRNRSSRVSELEERCGLFAKYFGTIIVLVVENDSNDQTREKLLQWVKRAPLLGYQVEVLGCQINSKRCNLKTRSGGGGTPETIGHSITQQRLDKMAALRNKYVDTIRARYSNFDLVLVWDLDTSGSLYIDGVLSSVAELETYPEMGGICAKGIYKYPVVGEIYYDTFAHSEDGLQSIVETLGGGKLVKQLSTATWAKLFWPTTPIHKVKRCFSGATLYRTKVLLDSSYATRNLECEHDSISASTNMAVNQNMINYILENI